MFVSSEVAQGDFMAEEDVLDHSDAAHAATLKGDSGHSLSGFDVAYRNTDIVFGFMD
jgi:hypothetical protein